MSQVPRAGPRLARPGRVVGHLDGERRPNAEEPADPAAGDADPALPVFGQNRGDAWRRPAARESVGYRPPVDLPVQVTEADWPGAPTAPIPRRPARAGWPPPPRPRRRAARGPRPSARAPRGAGRPALAGGSGRNLVEEQDPFAGCCETLGPPWAERSPSPGRALAVHDREPSEVAKARGSRRSPSPTPGRSPSAIDLITDVLPVPECPQSSTGTRTDTARPRASTTAA